MIFITAIFTVREEFADQWLDIAGDFTTATRSEPGCRWFDWYRNPENPQEYALVEAFADDEAGAAHVQSKHFRTAQEHLPQHLAQTPRIVSTTVDQDDWSTLGEMAVD